MLSHLSFVGEVFEVNNYSKWCRHRGISEETSTSEVMNKVHERRKLHGVRKLHYALGLALAVWLCVSVAILGFIGIRMDRQQAEIQLLYTRQKGENAVLSQQLKRMLEIDTTAMSVEIEDEDNFVADLLNRNGLGVTCSDIAYDDETLIQVNWHGLTVFLPREMMRYSVEMTHRTIALQGNDVLLSLELRRNITDYEDYMYDAIAMFLEENNLDNSKVVLESVEDSRAFIQVQYERPEQTYCRYFAVISINSEVCLYLEMDYAADVNQQVLDELLVALKTNVTLRFL